MNQLQTGIGINELGASPLVAMVFTVALVFMASITLVLTVALRRMASSEQYLISRTPEAEAKLQQDVKGYNLTMDNVDWEVDLEDVFYPLKDRQGAVVTLGRLLDVLDLDIDQDHVSISYDGAGTTLPLLFSSEDIIHIKDLENGGLADRGYTLILRFRPTGETMLEQTL